MTVAQSLPRRSLPGRWLRFLGRMLLASIGFVFRVLIVAWATLAIYFSNLPWPWLRTTLAIAFLAFGVWAFWLTRRRRMPWIAAIATVHTQRVELP